MPDSSKNLRIIRELRNLPQKYIAHKLNMSQSNYSRIENGRVKISGDDLLKISEILKVKASLILEFDDSDFIDLISKKDEKDN